MVVRRFNATSTAKSHIMVVGDAYMFPGFLTPVLTQLFFPKPPTTFPTCFCRGERRKYAGKKSRLNRGSNSQPPSHESETLTTEPPGRDAFNLDQLEIFNFLTGNPEVSFSNIVAFIAIVDQNHTAQSTAIRL